LKKKINFLIELLSSYFIKIDSKISKYNKINVFLAFLCSYLLTIYPLMAQNNGRLHPGNIFGNPGSVEAPGSDAPFSSMLDKNFGSILGSILKRGVSGWYSLPQIDVTSYGVICDSQIHPDNTANFNAAIAVAITKAAEVYIPAASGFCCLNPPGLNIINVIKIRGESWISSSIAACGQDFTPVTINSPYTTLENLIIVGKGAAGDPLETTFGASYPALTIGSNCSQCQVDYVRVLGGYYSVNNQSGEIQSIMLDASQSYGPSIFYSQGGGEFYRSQFDQTWPCADFPICIAADPGGFPPAADHINNWAANTPYNYGDVAFDNGYIIQAITSGTSGSVAPTLQNYNTNMPDNNITWWLVGRNPYSAIQLDTNSNQNYFEDIDSTGAFTSSYIMTNTGGGTGAHDSECVHCVMSQSYGDSVYMAPGTAALSITDSTMGCVVVVGIDCAAVHVDGSTNVTITGGYELGYYGIESTSNATSWIQQGVNIYARAWAAIINTGSNRFVFNNNTCNGMGDINDATVSGTRKILQSICP
jgi:hypothetical protein